ncbi:MAG: hypothetical protein P8Y24_07725 [Gammaproteobacteria bacterium]|jgi:uncharacterized membrane protein
MNGEDSTSNAKLVYILYLVSILIGVTGLIGVIMAYVNRGDATDWLKSHYQFQIRTFWIGFLYMLLGVILAAVIVGYFILFFSLIWLIVRCVIGLKQLDKGEAINNPTSWMFG